ncbi:WD40 repeat-containing protein [Planoprotostelium fungivorum]|uniref:WD40 repeat-containing protein n=1 Tax=Planoprotostelium fungivorum TaxID=1890364 RepID=A0A2P6MX10_9EUKA|nr:WD40 repeat-containing protein [Planoprotostelium fungivorum]
MSATKKSTAPKKSSPAIKASIKTTANPASKTSTITDRTKVQNINRVVSAKTTPAKTTTSSISVKRSTPTKTEIPKSTENFLDALPIEILMEVLSFLKLQDIARFSCTCREYQELSNHPRYWKKLYSDMLSDKKERDDQFDYKDQLKKGLMRSRLTRTQKRINEKFPTCNTSGEMKKLNLAWTIHLNDSLHCPVNQRQVFHFHNMCTVFCNEIPSFKSPTGEKRLTARAVQSLSVSVRSLWIDSLWNKPIVSIKSMKYNQWKEIDSDDNIIIMDISPDQPHSILIGLWKDKTDETSIHPAPNSELAWIMISVHHAQLLQLSSLQPQFTRMNPHQGDTGYTVYAQIRTAGTSKWSNIFYRVDLKRDAAGRSICLCQNRGRPSHVMEKRLSLPWKAGGFSGTLLDVFFFDIVVLDSANFIVWFHSQAVKLEPSPPEVSSNYDHPDDSIYFKWSVKEQRGRVDGTVLYSADMEQTMICASLKKQQISAGSNRSNVRASAIPPKGLFATTPVFRSAIQSQQQMTSQQQIDRRTRLPLAFADG